MPRYIIGSKNKETGEMSITSNPKIHTNLVDATAEAKRLAGKHTEKKFVILLVGDVYEAVQIRKTTL